MARPGELIRQEIGGFNWRLALARLVLAPLPDRVGPRVRPMVLRLVGFRIGSGTLMMGTPTITGPAGLHRRLVIGRDCVFNVGCHLEAGAEIVLEDRVGFGHEVMVLTTTHETAHPARRWGDPFSRPVRIGAGAWLGARSMVLPGVTIGPGAVVGAGALVNRDVPANTAVAGVPARVIRELDHGRAGGVAPASEAVRSR